MGAGESVGGAGAKVRGTDVIGCSEVAGSGREGSDASRVEREKPLMTGVSEAEGRSMVRRIIRHQGLTLRSALLQPGTPSPLLGPTPANYSALLGACPPGPACDVYTARSVHCYLGSLSAAHFTGEGMPEGSGASPRDLATGNALAPFRSSSYHSTHLQPCSVVIA